jgi:hypothetical protein
MVQGLGHHPSGSWLPQRTGAVAAVELVLQFPRESADELLTEHGWPAIELVSPVGRVRVEAVMLQAGIAGQAPGLPHGLWEGVGGAPRNEKGGVFLIPVRQVAAGL